WTELQSRPYTPAPRQEHAAVWDDPDQSLLVFGGYRSASEFLGDLWSYRPAFGSWQTLGGAPPSARSGTAAAWDAARRRLLIFGGYGPTGYFADLWSYHPDTNTWMELAPGEAPPAREEATAVWDTANDELLVYGGQRDGRLLDDLWAYEPEANRWAEPDPEGDWPAARQRRGGRRLGPSSAQAPRFRWGRQRGVERAVELRRLMAAWMLYGANGYTGQLIAAEAARRGLKPILAGRNEPAVRSVADRH